MGSISLYLTLIGACFVAVECIPVYHLTGLLSRQVRSFPNQAGFNNFGGGGFGGAPQTNPMFFNQQQPMAMGPQNSNLRTEIADSINVQKPNLNKNIGATSSSSISNAALINQGPGGPGLKLGQGLALAISIQGPEGAATNDTFANTQMFNTDRNDVGQSFANAGNIGRNTNTAQTGTNIQLQGNPNQLGQATSFNQANVNMFNAGLGGRGGGRTGNANAMGGVQG